MEEELKKKLDDKRNRKMLDINDEKWMKEIDLEKNSGGSFVNIWRGINQKLNLLEKEGN